MYEIEIYVLGGLLVTFEVDLDRCGDLEGWRAVAINGTRKGNLGWLERRVEASPDDMDRLYEAAFYEWCEDGNVAPTPTSYWGGYA